MIWFIGIAHHNWATFEGWTEWWGNTVVFTDPHEAEKLRLSWLGSDPENNPLNSAVSVYEISRMKYEELASINSRIDRNSAF